ncbi:MAG: ATP-grasp domain-containing protein [Candidatus Heimdallarchaeota archaeon]|nr:ATP-grasp domain-containing protein [Candidatus Heimdallarchaeota archaeon]
MKRILIVDYIVGGGFAEEDLPVNILAEGYSILRSCIEQFAQLGFKIATLIDHRLMQHIRISPIHEFKSVSSHEDFVSGIKAFADQVDYALTLAPESKGILKDLSSIIVNSQATFLGSKPDSIEQAGDKLKTMNLAKELGLNVPATFSPSYNDSFDKIQSEVDVLGYPLIVKPIDGVGCQGLIKVTNPNDLGFGLQAAHAVTSMDNCIVQEFIEGTPISTSLLVNDDKVVPISINHQNLRLDSMKKSGDYLGGEVPYSIPKYNDEIFETSVKLVEQMNLNGFIGVDLVVGEEGVFVIEVNPRVTVPFIAINELANRNVAKELIEIVEKGKITGEIKLNGSATFSKITVPSTFNKVARFERTAIIDGVLSPPFPVGNNSHSYTLLMGLGATMEMARKNFRNIKNEVLKSLS